MPKSRKNVLVYSSLKANRSTVRRAYQKWREGRGLPVHCDNSTCLFHTAPPRWNGLPLPLILDHIDGNSRDNRPEMLRYLCPNCDSQLATRGGKNRGRVMALNDDSFILGERDVDVFLRSFRVAAFF